jgi:sugar lactone lactonase YvrE
VTRNIEAVGTTRDPLGEGPYWDAAAEELVRVDVEAGLVLRLDPATGVESVLEFGAAVGFAVPTSKGELLVARERDLLVVSRDGSQRPFATLDPSYDRGRFNDGKCDSRGRLVTGSIDPQFEFVCSLYVVEGDGALRTITGGIAVSNGIGWDDDRGLMYYTDTWTHRIDVFDYDLETGEATNRRTFADVPEEDGLPDGLEVDAEGGVWVALFRGGEVRRFDPDGTVSERVTTPTSCPTSITFGGPDLRTAYVTSSRSWLTDEQRATEELGGAVLAFDAGVAGRPVGVFELATD